MEKELRTCDLKDQPSAGYARQAKKGNKMKKEVVVVADAEEDANITWYPSCGQEDTKGTDHQEAATLPDNHVNIEAMLLGLLQTEHGLAQADRCLSELNLMMRHLGPSWTVRPFGSYANGFGTLHSDLDVTCCNEGVYHTTQQAASDLQDRILPMVRQHSAFTIVEEIFGARVPILKLRFENVLDVDVSCHNAKPLMNTSLLRAYSRIDPRIQQLGVAVKLWAKGVGVCDAAKSNLSSYAFTLLVIYFLQVHADVQLPVLPVTAFRGGVKRENDEEEVIAARALWQCRLSTVELLSRFFAFYSGNEPNAFVWGSEVVSVRSGARHFSQEEEFVNLRGRGNWRIHIEDPYQVERNLHIALGEAEERKLYSAFWEASEMPPNQVLGFTLNQLQGSQQSASITASPSAYKPQHEDVPNPTVECKVRFDSAESVDGEWIGRVWHSKADLAQEDRAKSGLADLLQVYKMTKHTSNCSSELAMGSSGSTNSGGTALTLSSDDESSSESCVFVA